MSDQHETPSISSETTSEEAAGEQPPNDFARSTSIERLVGHSALPLRTLSVPHGSNAAGSQPRTFSTTSYTHRNLWQPGQPIVFGNAGTVGGSSGRQLSNVANRRVDARSPRDTAVLSTVADSSSGIAARMGGARILETGRFTVPPPPPSDTLRGPERPKKPEQDDVFLRVPQISEDANDCFSRLETEMKKIRLSRKRPTDQLYGALTMVVEISQRARALLKSTEHTSNLLAKKIAKQLDEEESATSVSPEDLVTEEEAATEETASGLDVDLADEEVASETEPEVAYIPFSTYNMSQKILQVKRDLPDGNVNKSWDYSYYVNSEGKGVNVHYCNTIEDCEKILPLFMNEKVVGFDLEWVFPERSKTSIRQNVALVQVSSESNIALIHVAQMGFNKWGKPLDPNMAIEDVSNLISPTLRQLIESPHILKVGVNVLGDHRRLRQFLGVKPQGAFELSDLHNLVHATEKGLPRIPKRLISLANQTLINLGLPLDKGPVRSSDWSRPMTPDQLRYAASDAYVGLRIFDVLETRRQALNPRPPRPAPRDIDGPDDLFGAAAAVVEAAEAAAARKTATTTTAATITRSSTTTTTTMTTTTNQATTTAAESDDNQSSEETIITTLTDKFSTQINTAGEWMATYTSSFSEETGGPALSKSQLRAYALWHHGALDIADIARIWRDPPLKHATVATYILDAIMAGKLPCDVDRAKEAHNLISAQLRDRYRSLMARLR